MALQRIRLQSLVPLPPLRVWFLVPQDVADIQALKLALCTQLTPLRDSDIQPAQLVIEIDDFELLGDSSIDLVREGDVIMLKHRKPILPVPDTLKRKANVEKPIRAQKRRRLLTNSQDSSSSSSSSSQSSSSDSSTTSSSSDSDTDTSSISDHSPSKEPQLNSSSDLLATQRQLASGTENHTITQQVTVPPGLGKASTHSRNKRRKIKRKFAAARVAPLNGISRRDPEGDETESSILTRDGPVLEPLTRPVLPTAVSRTPSSSLGNRNKSKGFKKAMEGAIPQKVVFNSAASHTPSVVTYSPCAPTFIPPSEREDLPKHIFVTSVDVEWRTGQGRTRWQGGEETPQEPAPEIHVAHANIHQVIDWDVIETKWEDYKTLDLNAVLSSDTIVAWKAFGLDPVTLTPQACMLHLGKVVSADQETLLVQPLLRPGIGHAAFGRACDEEDEALEPLSLHVKEARSNGWKLISHQ